MEKKYALVTGASSGLGWEFSLQLAQKGYNLIISSRREDRLQSLKAEIKNFSNVKVEIIEADLSSISGARRIINFVEKRKVNVEYLVNNAGYGYYGNFSDKSYMFWAEMLNVNLSSVVFLTSHLINQMKEKNTGKIMFVSSVAGFMPVPYFTVYAAAKSFVLHFAEGLAEELKDTGVKVSVLCPGPTDTEFFQTASEGKGIKQTRGFDDPAVVVSQAISKLEKGKRVIVPGFKNKVQVFFTKISGRNLVTKVAAIVINKNRI
jgi:hypothetical protein